MGSDHALATVTQPTYIDGLDPDDFPYPMIVNEDGNMVRVFDYVCPFLITIDDDLLSSYLLTIMNDNKTFRFDSINTDSNLQFVATNMNWHRRYIYEDEDGFIDLTGVEGYYGELTYQMQYRGVKGDPFPWLFIDPETLREQAAQHGFNCEILARGEHYDYLARLTRHQ
jgi:hypothetical protein